MTVNTTALDDGKYVTMSSLSIVASRATVTAQDIVATSTLSAAALTLTGALTTSLSTQSMTAIQVNPGAAINPSIAFNSEKSSGFYRSGASQVALSYSQLDLINGAATQPSFGFRSEMSLGLFRSATSTIKQSYGTADFSATWFKPSVNTAAVTGLAQIPDGVLVVSPTNNVTYSLAFKSGLTIFLWASTSTVVS